VAPPPPSQPTHLFPPPPTPAPPPLSYSGVPPACSVVIERAGRFSGVPVA
jgi:hypothetical protein